MLLLAPARPALASWKPACKRADPCIVGMLPPTPACLHRFLHLHCESTADNVRSLVDAWTMEQLIGQMLPPWWHLCAGAFHANRSSSRSNIALGHTDSLLQSRMHAAAWISSPPLHTRLSRSCDSCLCCAADVQCRWHTADCTAAWKPGMSVYDCTSGTGRAGQTGAGHASFSASASARIIRQLAFPQTHVWGSKLPKGIQKYLSPYCKRGAIFRLHFEAPHMRTIMRVRFCSSTLHIIASRSSHAPGAYGVTACIS